MDSSWHLFSPSLRWSSQWMTRWKPRMWSIELARSPKTPIADPPWSWVIVSKACCQMSDAFWLSVSLAIFIQLYMTILTFTILTSFNFLQLFLTTLGLSPMTGEDGKIEENLMIDGQILNAVRRFELWAAPFHMILLEWTCQGRVLLDLGWDGRREGGQSYRTTQRTFALSVLWGEHITCMTCATLRSLSSRSLDHEWEGTVASSESWPLDWLDPKFRMIWQATPRSYSPAQDWRGHFLPLWISCVKSMGAWLSWFFVTCIRVSSWQILRQERIEPQTWDALLAALAAHFGSASLNHLGLPRCYPAANHRPWQTAQVEDREKPKVTHKVFMDIELEGSLAANRVNALDQSLVDCFFASNRSRQTCREDGIWVPWRQKIRLLLGIDACDRPSWLINESFVPIAQKPTCRHC